MSISQGRTEHLSVLTGTHLNDYRYNCSNWSCEKTALISRDTNWSSRGPKWVMKGYCTVPIQYHYYSDLKIIHATGVKEITLSDLMGYAESVLEIREDLTGAIEYLDLSKVRGISITYLSAQRMVEIYKKWIARGVEGSVLYAPSDLCYGMARMISFVLSEVEGGTTSRHLVIRTPVRLDYLPMWFAREKSIEKPENELRSK